MLNGRQLREKFQDFNAAYFNNRLPPYSIRVVPHITWMGESGRHNKKRRLIEIQQGLEDCAAISILIHEMAHARTGDQHGRRPPRLAFCRKIAGIGHTSAIASPLSSALSISSCEPH